MCWYLGLVIVKPGISPMVNVFDCLFVYTGLVIVTDAVPAMGLGAGTHHIGQQKVEIKDGRAVIAGTNTLCGRYNLCHSHLLVLFSVA